jgi:peptidoglycan/xylan/chitin deacetylase (PgdA/CDA1 family)
MEGLPLLAWPWHRQVLTILIYHRVLPLPDPLRAGEAVAPVFDQHMAYIARHFSVLPLVEAGRRLQAGTLPRRACCITFDDGYADNLTVALPILEKHGLPATVFVATGYLDGGRMFNDAVIDAVAGAPGPVLDLAELGLGRHPVATLDERRAAVPALLEQVKYLAPDERDACVARLVARAGGGPLPAGPMLTSAQVGELARRGIEIGGHTVAHNILTTLDDAQARQEMLAGKERLEQLTGRPVRVFAYPNGRPGRDYAARHVAIARELDIEFAVSTASGVANRGTDPRQLPRFTPWGASTWKLGARIARNAWTGRPAVTC